MPFTLIKGTFYVVGYSPDGDSIRFKANNPKNWEKISGRPKINKKEHVQLRFEGIDALETHFTPKVKGAKSEHQPMLLGKAARDYTISAVGIKNVKWGPKDARVSRADDGVAGYILTRAIDNNKFGRPVSFVYAGTTAKADGSEVHLDVNTLKKSINYKLIESGNAYPTYYPTLFYDLRNAITNAVKKARSAKKGLWPQDKTSGFTLSGKEAVTDQYPIFPKLFRRLIEHLAKGGTVSNFRQFLEDKKDGVLILPEAHHTSALDYIVEVKGKKIGMKVLPENLVFDPQL